MSFDADPERRIMSLPLIGVAMIVLAGGCAHVPADLQYVAPTAQDGPIATLMGSQLERILSPDIAVYVQAVDGKQVMTEGDGSNTALPLKAGRRNIAVAFKSGYFYAQAELVLDAVAGRRYQLRFLDGVHPHAFGDFWIVDLATGEAVAEMRRVAIENKNTGPDILFVPH